MMVALVAFASCSKSQDEKAVPASQSSGPTLNTAAIAEMKAALDAKPGDADLIIRIGDEYFEARYFPEAFDYYKKALPMRPDNPDLYNEIGLTLHYMGRSAEAIGYINDGIKKNPYHQRILLTKGFILFYGLGDRTAAKDAWKKAKAINPDSQIGRAAAEFLDKFNGKG